MRAAHKSAKPSYMRTLLQHNGLWGLAAIALFLFGITTLYQTTHGLNQWRLSGDFDSVGELKVDSKVMLSGFAIGKVESLTLQPDLKIRVTMLIDEGIEIPDDSDLRIQTTGLFSTPSLDLMLGGGFDLLEDGDEIAYTQSSVDFIELFEKIVTKASTHSTALEQENK